MHVIIFNKKRSCSL